MRISSSFLNIEDGSRPPLLLAAGTGASFFYPETSTLLLEWEVKRGPLVRLGRVNSNYRDAREDVVIVERFQRTKISQQLKGPIKLLDIFCKVIGIIWTHYSCVVVCAGEGYYGCAMYLVHHCCLPLRGNPRTLILARPFMEGMFSGGRSNSQVRLFGSRGRGPGGRF